MRLHRYIATACVAAALGLCAAAAMPAGAASTQTAPTIHESFTLLACPNRPRTTLQLEGCAEHRVIAIDQTIDSLNARVYSRLSKGLGRPAFIRANADWVRYRNAICSTQASIYSGGSIQPVAYLNCLIAIDKSHVSELKGMLVALIPAG